MDIGGAMLILASKSPRRRELLTMAGLAYECIPSQVEEHVPAGTPAGQIPVILSAQKAEDVFASHPDALVIGADTVVAVDDLVLGKPKDAAEAAAMLRTLSGKTHTVYTGVTLRDKNGTESFCSGSKVTFYELTEQEIAWYVETGEPMDKAGAYGIQGHGCILVKHIEGDFFTIVGLPVAETVRRVQRRAAALENDGE